MSGYHPPLSTGEVVAELPSLLGRAVPGDSAVVVGISHLRPDYAATVSVALDDDPAGLADDALAALCAEGAEAVAVFVYAADAADHTSAAGQLAAAVVLRADRHQLRVLDAVRVVGDRWASDLCPEPSCCPPDGNLIPTPKEHHP